MNRRAALALIATAALLMSACGEPGLVGTGDPNVEVVKLNLTVDKAGALVDPTCSGNSCASYPNPLGCEHLAVSVRGDGTLQGACRIEAQVQKVTAIAEGVPLACRVNKLSHCVQCLDIYGEAVVNTCGNQPGTELSRGTNRTTGQGQTVEPGINQELTDQPLGADDVVEPTVPDQPSQTEPPKQPTGSTAGVCAPVNGRNAVYQAINAMLQAEGLKFSYNPKAHGDDGFFGNSTFTDTNTICDSNLDNRRTDCDNSIFGAGGGCYCGNAPLMGGTCRCARMTNKALQNACAAIPANCDRGVWGAAILKAYGKATKWLTGGNKIPFGKPPLAQVTGPQDLMCMGSPLVLDLNGDGVELSSAAEGVQFDLYGQGTPARTSWIKGKDDALLAIDRDGDGTIDSGMELFGEALSLAGSLPADGFAALAELDRADMGGNGNGLVEAGDLLFGQLLLWRDKNRDGRSQAGELTTLSEAGIRAIPVAASRDGGDVFDGHGNDLSLRGSFIRDDGTTGTTVDVYFTN